tara:strand:- start:501 stop:965 length:465 start_codon:yes stop_codon:yes gene_type:complete
MNQIFAGGIAFIIALWLWSKGKKPQFNSVFEKPLTNNRPQTDNSFVQTFTSKDKVDKFLSEKIIWSKPITSRDKILLRKKLMNLIQAGPEERLRAVSIASEWGHSAILPILKRGLKDSDSRVIIIAAKGIQKIQYLSKNTQRSSRPPLNVFLMR